MSRKATMTMKEFERLKGELTKIIAKYDYDVGMALSDTDGSIKMVLTKKIRGKK